VNRGYHCEMTNNPYFCFMIDIKTKIHDKYSIEFKVGFKSERKSKFDDFSMAMWIFVPGSLDINSTTYSKASFYQDLKSNVRLITPVYRLDDIAGKDSEPFSILRKAIADVSIDPSEKAIKEYEYNLKIFAAIVKSSLRDSTDLIVSESDSDKLISFCGKYCSAINDILREFHSLRTSIISLDVTKKHLDSYRYADEFICHIVASHVFKVISYLHEQQLGLFDDTINSLKSIIKEIDHYRIQMEYPTVSTDDSKNAIFIHRQSSLKKFVERQLYLRVPKKKDGIIVEQVYYSLAAGLAMLFATVVAWAFQSTFGNLTWPLFIALIISYMMKDRIKELTRFYFVSKKASKYYDNKAKISMHDKEIGTLKEAMDFISIEKVPDDVMEKRHASPLVGADRRIGEDNVILYRKSIHLESDIVKDNEPYVFPGIHDIIRLQVNSFIHKMDNPSVDSVYIDEDDLIHKIPCAKNYYLNFVLKYTCDGNTEFKRFRVTLNRNGITAIDSIAI